MDAARRSDGAEPRAAARIPVVTVRLPSTLTAPEPPSEITCEAATAGEALRAVAARMPRLAGRVFHGEQLLVHVLLNGASLLPAEAQRTELRSGDRLELVPPIAGG